MTIADNSRFAARIEDVLRESLPIKLGVNKKNELVRLVYEISRANDISVPDVVREAGIHELAADGKGGLFHRVKKALLRMRYPSLEAGDDPRIMPVAMKPARRECPVWNFELDPDTIFIEKGIKFTTPTQAELAKWRTAMKPVFDGYIAKLNAKGLPGDKMFEDYAKVLKELGHSIK